MTVTAVVLMEGTQVSNAQTTQYTCAASTKIIIDKFTATNTTGAAATLSVNLVPTAGAAGSSNLILSAKSLAASECYTCPELVGQVLSAGDFISTLSGTNNAITIRVSGRAVT
jgi:hypothetical protein